MALVWLRSTSPPAKIKNPMAMTILEPYRWTRYPPRGPRNPLSTLDRE